MKIVWGKLKAIGFGLFFGLLLCEIILRIYNPFPFALKKGKIILPANQTKIYTNNWISKLDNQIFYSRNSLGLRGPELPDSLSKFTSVLTVGGSTTECRFLSDDKTWPSQLYKDLKKQDTAIWLNNAGLDGHSTFGHLLLMQEYVLKLKPDYVLFLTGINDIEEDKPDQFDLMSEKKINTRSFKLFIKSLLNHTELGRTLFNFYSIQLAYKRGLIHKEIKISDLQENVVPATVIQNRMNHQTRYLVEYRQRIDLLISECMHAGIKPVLITQPSLYGSYIDPATNISIGNKWLKNDDTNTNCMLEEMVLDLYNDVLRSYAGKVQVIDLARKMPKNSLYFYDFIHFTNSGAKQVADIISAELAPSIIHHQAL